MPSIAYVKGMLLEEVILFLLRVCGYSVIEDSKSDKVTLKDGPAGLYVKGRGSYHQLDGIADYNIIQPFTHRQRLLVEAKCYADNRPIGLSVVRNAVGVIKDVNEFWGSDKVIAPKVRYHYQYSLFSTAPFTRDAERYAFAQDIYLVPLRNSKYFKGIIKLLNEMDIHDFPAKYRNGSSLSLILLRKDVRNMLKGTGFESFHIHDSVLKYKIIELVETCQRINSGFIAMLGGVFPIFLVPNEELIIRELRNEYTIRITWDKEGWYIEDTRDNKQLFSFDLPSELFLLYHENGFLTETKALDLKQSHFMMFSVYYYFEQVFHQIRFKLDVEWIESLRRNIRDREEGNHE